MKTTIGSTTHYTINCLSQANLTKISNLVVLISPNTLNSDIKLHPLLSNRKNLMEKKKRTYVVIATRYIPPS